MCVGEHDVEMRGGPEEEIIEMGWHDDEQGEQEDYEAGRRQVKKLHDPKFPSETQMREHFCKGTRAVQELVSPLLTRTRTGA